VLEQIVGVPVTAYRAPSFSITKRSLWALEVLVEEGFTVDSSVFPIYHDRYGIPNALPHAHEIATPAGPIWEVPASVARFARFNVPVGGGYFRLYPWKFTRACLRRINDRTGRPFMFYVHPWEIDPQQPRLPGASRVARFRHYVNLHKTEAKLSQLLREFRFDALASASQLASSSIRTADEVSA
jgi:polysaccharide deacetylase family protein (PEP-CTERM system associated)